LTSKKHIVLVIPSLQAGGMERVMTEVANYLVGNPAYKITMVLYGISREIFYHLDPRVEVVKPSFLFDNNKRFLSTIKTLAFLRRTFNIIKPDRILSFGELWNNFVMIAILGTKYQVILSDRSQPDKGLGAFHERLRKIFYPKAFGIIAQTHKALEIYKKKYKHTNIKVIGNPIRSIESAGLQRENIILSVGRLIKSKNHEALIRIFANLKGADTWKLVIVGYDHLKQQNQKYLEALADELGVRDRVEFAGKQKDVESYYLMSKIFAFTSQSEGFPNVVGEAMAAGLPIISYDCVAGPSDLIEDGFNGFLIPLNDEVLFLEKLQQMIENPELLNQFGSNSLFKVSEFEPSGIMQKFECFLTYKLKISDNE
jgi:GalNAc-alpha-(1->4)-GalNAc-alpha-(1->3)-diNAcBac-PP-undecaprenol alpha-1,4-N-acetyl-D-galactosaminyltransferase